MKKRASPARRILSQSFYFIPTIFWLRAENVSSIILMVRAGEGLKNIFVFLVKDFPFCQMVIQEQTGLISYQHKRYEKNDKLVQSLGGHHAPGDNLCQLYRTTRGSRFQRSCLKRETGERRV